MEHNVIPLFIVRHATGIILNDIPKIYCSNLRKEDHCISHNETGLSIKLTLDGMFYIYV